MTTVAVLPVDRVVEHLARLERGRPRRRGRRLAGRTAAGAGGTVRDRRHGGQPHNYTRGRSGSGGHNAGMDKAQQFRMRHPKRLIRDWWKVGRVALHLVLSPRDIASYLRFGLTERSPLELGMPWWSFGAVRAIGAALRPEMRGFEFGSGGSSMFLASRIHSLRCVEDEVQWVELVRAEAAKRGHQNLEIIHAPFDFMDIRSFKSSEYLGALTGRYDLIVVDGKEMDEPVRDECFWKAESHINKGGVIVLDDAYRYPRVMARNRARRFVEYKGTGYARAGVTSTALFFY